MGGVIYRNGRGGGQTFVIYISNAGSTARYAKLLAHQLDLTAYSAEEAKEKVPAGAEVIYLGWIMAGSIMGCGAAMKLYKVRAVCGVGRGYTGTMQEELREKNNIPTDIPVFMVQGNFAPERLHGIYKMMAGFMVMVVGKASAEKNDFIWMENRPRIREDKVKLSNLGALLTWCEQHNIGWQYEKEA